MNKKFISIAVLFLVSVATLNPAYGRDLSSEKKSDTGFVSGLKSLDAFHPPIAGDEASLMYKEWHYFTMVNEAGDVTFSTILSLEGDTSNPATSYALNIQNFATPSASNNTLDAVPIELAQWSDKTPNVSVDKSSISFDGNAYQIHTESLDGKVIFDGTWKPEIKPEAVVKLPVGSAGNYMNWLLSSPELSVNGTLIVNKGTDSEKIYYFKNARGYHDHNWGYWDWADDFGWNWGQAIEKDTTKCIHGYGCKRDGKYALTLLNMIDSHDTESKSTVLKVWKNKKKVSIFKNADVQIQHRMMDVPYLPSYQIPEINYITAYSGWDNLNIVFTTKDFDPIYLPIEGGYRIIWELTGTFEVSGRLNGKRVQFETEGSMEYFGEPLLDQ